MAQLSLFSGARDYDGPAEHFTTTGIGTAGWTGSGQFYWDLRRWSAGADLPDLTAKQETYFRTGGR